MVADTYVKGVTTLTQGALPLDQLVTRRKIGRFSLDEPSESLEAWVLSQIVQILAQIIFLFNGCPTDHGLHRPLIVGALQDPARFLKSEALVHVGLQVHRAINVGIFDRLHIIPWQKVTMDRRSVRQPLIAKSAPIPQMMMRIDDLSTHDCPH